MTKPRILIIEDEILIARELEVRLKGFGYAVVRIALSGEEGVQGASELQPDIVLMDIVLKGALDGIAAANEIRTRFDIPVVYVTAYADESTLRRAKVTEPYGYILKPFSESEVHAAVEMALYKHQRERNLREAKEAGLLLAAIVESSSDAIIGWTLGGTIFSWNPGAERLYGYSASEALGQCIATLMVPPEWHMEIAQIQERIEKGQRVEDYETVRVRKDGLRIEVSLTVCPIRNAAGEILGVAAIGRESTELKQAEKKPRVLNEDRAAQ
jgi:PAS domain S-box-containing protein